MKKTLSLILALLMLTPTVLASCAESGNNGTDKGNGPQDSSDSVNEETATETENPYYEGYVDPFADVKFDGKTFMVHNSVNAAATTMPASTYLIEGPETYTGDAASDAAYDRNLTVMDSLDVKLQFEPYDYSWSKTAGEIRTLIQTGDTTYDLIINDMLGLVPISSEGLFYNVSHIENFDYDAPWWYDDFMADISLSNELRFALAGDFFIDLLRTSHALYMNKDVYTNLQLGDPEEVYTTVINNEWTIDKLNSLTSNGYIDVNGDGTADGGDQYGIILTTSWGPLIPFLISCDPDYTLRDENGYPSLNIQTERSVQMVEKLTELYNAPYNSSSVFDEATVVTMFTQGQSLFLGYQRLGTLESEAIRDADIGLAVLPYPKLDENQANYITSVHDTSELGFIPITVPEDRIDFVTTVIEVLCRETYKQVLPVYYESSLKVKYTRDSSSAQMIDIIHDNFGNAFALAYASYVGDFLEATYASPIMNNDGTFSSKAKAMNKVAEKTLQSLIKNSEKFLDK